ncbi:MAG: hypothetical protein ABI863_20280 [Ginsengibacter sp.]
MKIKLKGIIFLFPLTIFLCLSITSCAQNEITRGGTPKELSESMIHNPDFLENAKGENFCWHAAVGIDRYVENFQLTKNTEWLDAGIRYFDFLIDKMDTDPDGYKGWIGPAEYNDKYWQDALVGDAILMEGILNFCVLVLENDSLKKKYAIKANFYTDIAKKDFFEKWDKKAWHDDGPYGAYSGSGKFLKPGNFKEWINDPSAERSGISHPFNKQMDAGAVCLRLWRITGNKLYRDRAEKIFFTAKSHFQYFDNHYCWNYFEPLTPEDVDLEKKDTRHGVWVHMWRSGYQAREVERIAEAYHYGIVFDKQDIKRIINTNLGVMWNKDKVHPKFINSNGLGADNDTTGIAAFQAAWGHSTVFKNAGELWTGLLDFDQTIRDLYELQFRKGDTSTELLLYENTTLKNPPGFKRKYSKDDVTVPVVHFTESKELNLATVLPHSIAKGTQSIIICKSWIAGELTIDLYSTAGEQINNLYKGKIGEGIFMITWNGKDPSKKAIYKGDYKIRWTIGTGYREFPIVVE